MIRISKIKHLTQSVFFIILLSFSYTATADFLSKEYQIKAAILVKISQFFSWESAMATDDIQAVNFCLFQPEPFGTFIDNLVQKRNSMSEKTFLNITRVTNDISSCHILFLTGQDAWRVGELTHRKDLLLISENSMIADTELHLNLFLDNRKVKFEINVDNISKSNIKLNSKLVTVAKIVRNTLQN